MAEVVGGALLSAFLDALVDRLASPEVINFFGKKKSVAKQLDKLNITLWSANALLNDAEDKQIKDRNIKKWVDRLNEVLNEADNVVDEINTEAIRREIKGDKAFLKRLGLTTQPINAFDRAIKQKIENIIDVLDLLLDQKDRLGLKEGVRSKKLERSPAPLIGDSSDVYGRDGDKEAIVEFLFSESVDGGDKIPVIPIVGMGGVGKTTLARLVYDDDRVKNHFEHKVWVTVSDDFDVLKLAKLVFEGLVGEVCKAEDIGKLRDELEKFMSGKKFFIVLDDVWNENYVLWSSLKRFLQFGGNGSKIIVTTRSDVVASNMGSVQSHHLKTISDGDCWKLFEKHAFRSIEASAYHEVEKVGRKIVEKCKGLPLAVMSLAGLLCSVSDPKEWKEILKSDVWELQERGNDEVLPSLWLSYTYLPSSLKRCFAYCSIFPKDHKYNKRRTILLWMAEGLLQGENMEDVGEEYFKTLISRSLFQRATDDGTMLVMHDLVHDLATFVSGKGFCIRLFEVDGLHGLTNKTRHLLYVETRLPKAKKFQLLAKENSLRTFLALPSAPVYNPVNPIKPYLLVKKFERLRVLCLSKSWIKQVPKSIGKLKHLRHLDLSATPIKRLPDSICTLYNLQTLLLNSCRSLTRLPTNMSGLVNLRHLDISNTVCLKPMPLPSWNLRGLRTLNKLVLDVEPSPDVLRELRKLSKDELRLKRLEIVNYKGEKISEWVADASFSNTTEVTLSDCKNCCHLPPLGQLPLLKILTLTNLPSVKTISSEFYGGPAAFISLEVLTIQWLSALKSMSFASQSFSRLKKLMLVFCLKLNSPLPHRLPSLKNLKIYKCEEMEELLPIGHEMNIAFPSLEEMEIEGCPKLKFSGLPLPSSLIKLCIFSCKMVLAQRTEWGLESLQHMRIGDKANFDSFPEERVLPTTLTTLKIENCPNLKSLSGEGFQHLNSLKELSIYRCPKLRSLPDKGLPVTISWFYVWNCPHLVPRLIRETGQEWRKISHIRNVITWL